MTREEFEQQYAERSGITVEELRIYRTVLPCDCGEEGCEGWQMVPISLADDPMIRRWGA
jgi:hypothetical protein